MTPFDSALVIIWLLVIFYVGIASGSSITKAKGFWINPGGASTLMLVVTIVATQVGAGTIIGIASSTFKNGTGFGIVAVVSTVLGFLAISRIAPQLKHFGAKYGAVTLSEVFGKRYGIRTQRVAGVIIIFAYLSFLAGQLVASWRLLSMWTGLGSDLSLLFAVGGLIIYTAFTGLKGDIETDQFHFWMMTIGLCISLSVFIGIRIHDLSFLDRIPNEIWSPVTFNGYPYLVFGILLGLLIPIVQMELWMRVYSSTDENQAKRSFYWSSIIVVPFYLFALVLGLIAYSLYPRNADADSIVFRMMGDYLPTGLLGIGVAAVLAVILSTANTMTLVIGATLYRDILGRSVGEEKRELAFSRICTAGAGIVGAALAFSIPSIVQQILNAFFLIAILVPPLIGAGFWKRSTEGAATSSLALGFITTIAYLFINPLEAYIPGIVVSVISFVTLTLLTKHSVGEINDPIKLFGGE